ncbi:testis- and ovary-specific PAZ domain-containing 1 isoform X2 [Labeo rohita]|uniref:Protein TOPAZ1 n=1 Tax=Labeo rohita TaxID=84645 RepID=A0A498N6V9_LABRO|nr:testis- and ovary-specific PAZ domain-containing 1 isoform X2 [Labeo rohita]
MALLKEPKGKHTLPYELFAESVCQQVSSSDMIKNILGRIGVSLIFRYHRTRDWNKGMKLVSVLFRLHIEFITLKGLMGNEHRVSRCQLVTMATEFFLYSGSIEGALKVLRADGWFVSSSTWPCEQADVENRKHVLTLLAGKTSHRDAFEILTNLPGIKEPMNGVQINDYTETFSAHLRMCLLKQTLPVAADILEFMLTHGMVPETIQLQNLIHRLGKQNNWSRARGLFKRAQSAGFYSAVVCERDSLFLPCSLTEIEMTLAFEMFITLINTKLPAPDGASQPLVITLRRNARVPASDDHRGWDATHLCGTLCGLSDHRVARVYSMLPGKTQKFKFSPVDGQYVNVVLPGEDRILTLCEVEVYAVSEDMVAMIQSNMINVAPNGRATQSSVNQGSTMCLSLAQNAIDGNRQYDLFKGSCTQTDTESNPWWRVDLIKTYTIASVALTNRGDCCSEQLNEAVVHIGDSLMSEGRENPVCVKVSFIPAGGTGMFRCDGVLEGRYVTVALPGENRTLSLCEVEVFGIPTE